MDVVLFKGILQKSSVKFGLLSKKMILSFEKDGKHLLPRDRSKQLIELPSEIDLRKIKKNSKEASKAIEFYLNYPELESTAFGAYMIDYYIQEMSNKDQIIEELDEEARSFFDPLIERFLQPTFLKNSAFYPNYEKESKVISRYALLDLELVFGTVLRNIEGLLFKDEKPVPIFPLRYSTRAVTEDDLDKLEGIVKERLAKWFSWRTILRKAPYFYNHIIHWIHQILEKLYPEDQEVIKDIVETTERAEVFGNPDIFDSLQQGEDFKADDLSSVSLNKNILYYLSLQYFLQEKQLTFKKYNQTGAFGYQNILISMANIFTSLPLFTNFNPPFAMIAGGLIEWIEQGLPFNAIRGNQQLDPYNIIPNALGFYLSIISSKIKTLKERKFLLAKSLEKIFSPSVFKEGLVWHKRSTLAMQGKDANVENIEITDEENLEKLKEIQESLDKYAKSLRLRKEKQEEIKSIVEKMNIIDKDFDEMKEERDNFLKINDSSKELLTDFQKDFLLSVQLFENDKKILDSFAELFDFTNKYIVLGNASSLYGLALLFWMISITNEGSLKWLTQAIEDKPDLSYESKILTVVCTIYNTSLQGLKIRDHPLIETTAPTVIVQTAQNLSEFLVAKDISEEENYPFYDLLIKNLETVYPM
ncbi:MAG: hypothetical protein HGN29_14120 [Asgard group archaeon]|nr:hypothetical protein [Asgard group archaeon]